MQSQAATVDAYLAELPADRRASLQKVREVILQNLDEDFEEGMLYGMIGYYVPHRIYPAGYHCDPSKPLSYMGLAAQKNHLSLYAMCVYMNGDASEKFRSDWAKTGKKLDMGKACIRFQSAEDLPLELIGELTARFKALEWARHCEAAISGYQAKKKAGKPAAKKSPPKKAAKKSAKKKPAKK